MSFDPHTNFAYGTVAIAPSPASSGTSLTVAAGLGALFAAVPANATVWPVALNALSTNAEIVRVTARVGDVLTIARAQEGTSARTILAGDQLAITITAKTLTDVEAGDFPNSVTAPDFIVNDTLSFAGNLPVATNPVTMAGGDDGFGDAAIIFDNPTDGLVVLKFNQYAILNTAGTFLVETQGNISLQRRAGSDVLAGLDIQDTAAALYTGFRDSANTSPITIGTGEAETSGNSGNITLITGMAGGGTRGSIALNAPSTVASGAVSFTPVAIAALHAAPTAGMVQAVNDALGPVTGSVVVAGGAAYALVSYSGTDWFVYGTPN